MMTWKMGNEMLFYPNRPHTWPPTSVRNAKCLMQIQMRHIRANFSRLGNTNHGIHIGSIHIDLTAKLMGYVTNFSNSFFKNTMR